MLKPQFTTYILAGVLVIIGGVIGYNYYQQQQQTKNQQTQREFMPAISTDMVTAISLIKKDSTVELAKQNDVWVITSDNNTPADSTAISELLSTLNHATIQTIASNQAATETSTFGLDETTRLEIVVKAGEQKVADVYIGKTGAIPQTYYALLPGASTIYIINGARYTLDKSSWKQPENPQNGEVTNVNMPITGVPPVTDTVTN
ncbi:MAG: DUF4340 domain-containing protein [Patescibacteria group bacterium]|jgi:hypothetical protein